MIRRMISGLVLSLLLAGVSSTKVHAWGESEHQILGDSVYHQTMRNCASRLGDTAYLMGGETAGFTFADKLSGGLVFGELCAGDAADDLARERFHERGKSILEQLQWVSLERINATWDAVMSGLKEFSAIDSFSTSARIIDLKNRNVVGAYLVYHLMALRMAAHGDELGLNDNQTLRASLRLEATAQGYLADGFSSGHMLVPGSGLLTRLVRRNNIETHNHYANQGVYVINSRGDVWQAFGDGVLQWYAPTRWAVSEACRSSLKEVLAVFFIECEYAMPTALGAWMDSTAPGVALPDIASSWLSDLDGVEFYSDRILPTLLLIPVPVAATWSFRTTEQDDYGISKRLHYPQLRDDNMHDPDQDGIDADFLYPRSALPDWLVPAPLAAIPPASADSMIRSDPDWASIRWVQDRYYHPSYKGLLLHLGAQLMFADGEDNAGGVIGVGYGLWDDLMVLRNVSFSVYLLPSNAEQERSLLLPSVGGGVPLDLAELRAIRLEGGMAIGLRSEYDNIGPTLALGLDSRAWPILDTNLGLSLRAKYQWFYLETTLKGPSLELILQ